MVVNEDAEPIDRCNLHFLALTRTRALRTGGLDESSFRAAGRGGPYELAQRLQSDYPEIAILGGLTDVESVSATDIEPLLRDLWPDEFSPARRLPKNESPTIRALREAL